MRKVFELTFAGEDVTVVTHDGSEGAVSRARELRPHAMIVDVALGAGSGYDLVRALRGDGHGGVPIYLLYSDQSPLDDASARGCGASGAMAKPFDSQAMIDRMRQALTGPAASTTAAATGPTPAPSVTQVTGNLTVPFGNPTGTPAVAPVRPGPTLPLAAAPVPAATIPRTAAAASRTAGPLPPPAAPPLGRAPLGTPTAPQPSVTRPLGQPFAPAPSTTGRPAPALTLDDEIGLDDLAAPAPPQPPPPPPSRPFGSPSGASFAAVPRSAAALEPLPSLAEPPSARAPSLTPAAPVVTAAPVEPAALAPEPVAPAAEPVVAPVSAVDRAVQSAAAGVADKVAGLGLTPAQVEAIAALTREVVERVVWEVVPVLAETMIREELARLTQE